MRVIAGSAKGRRLKVPKPTTTRPMTELVKGALFSMLAPFGLIDCRLLDLYAGSGSLGIEALSRGAAWAEFVEQNGPAATIIEANLALTGFSEQARLHRRRVTTYLSWLSEHPPPADDRFDLVIMDPPYAAPEIDAVLEQVATSPALAPNAVIVVGFSVRRTLPLTVGVFKQHQRRCHGDSCFAFYLSGAVGAPASDQSTEATAPTGEDQG